MSIWNDPEISFEEFASFTSNEKNKSLFSKSWNSLTKNKIFVSELESHELSSILLSYMKICIKSYNKTSSPTNDQLQDSSHLFSDWIFENKLSGIPLNDDDDYNKMKLFDIFNNGLLFKWLNESSLPLKTYILSKSNHDPSLSQAEILINNKKMMQKHPSLAHLFQQKRVNNIQQNIFYDKQNNEKIKKDIQFNKKQKDFDDNHHKLRKSKALLFFNHSDIGYEIKKKCKMYSDKKLTQFLTTVNKGDLIGGKIVDKKTQIIQIIEPIKGYIQSQYV